MKPPARPSPAPGPVQFGLFDAPPVDAAPDLLRHPRAQRELRLGEHRIAYELRRARRRSIGFVVSTEGLSVAAPRWVGVAEIEAALAAKSRWILRKLAEQQERARRQRAARVDWHDGTRIPFLGKPLQVTLDPGTTGVVLDAEGSSPCLLVGLALNAGPAQIRDAVQGWLQRQARRIFDERCAIFAERLQVKVRRLSLGNAQTRWGSASADGSVRLNWRLVHFPLAQIDYVVAHELAHLRHMDHSPRFWDAVRSVMPDYEAARERLRDELVPVLD